MRINFAHFYERATDGTRIECAVFEANARDGSNWGRDQVLHQLTRAARKAGLKIDQSALVYEQFGRLQFYGTPGLVDYLSESGVPNWTNTIDI